MLQHTQFKLSAARNRNESKKSPPQSSRFKSYDRNSEDKEENMKEQYYYESSPRTMDQPCKSDNNQSGEKSKSSKDAVDSMTGKSPSTTDKKD